MKELISEEDLDKPPLFKRWGTVYLVVTGWLVLLIALFHLFSISF